MSEEIIKVLDALADKFGLAVDWTSANVVPYLEQLCGKYVNYEIATSVVWIMLWLLFFIVGIICYKIVYKHKDWGVTYYETTSDDYFWRGLIYFCIISIFVVASLMVITQIFDIVTCFTFPEKIIIEELKSIYASMK